jgi:Flp pilus assembly protein TadD
VTACDKEIDKQSVDDQFQDLNVVDENGLNDVMLRVADPDEAVAYFARSVQQSPDRIDFARGLAESLTRARRYTEAVSAWARVKDMPAANSNDRVNFAGALVRTSQWDRAQTVLNEIPPSHKTFQRYRLEAMVAVSNQEWDRADSFYETALGLTVTPAGVMNNWGFSKLSRGDFVAAERLFADSIRQDSTLFTSKNNIVLARGAQGKYTLPVVPMTQIERAQLLHTMGLAAVKRGDADIGGELLREAIETHPQHFEEAVRSLRALEG